MSKKKDILLWITLAAVILLCGGITVWSLFHFSIIRIEKPYEPEYIDIDYNDLGSAKYLDGTTVWVSIFASDGAGTWDFTREADCAARDEMLGYFPIVADWLKEQGARYGKTLDFVYAQSSEDELLYYETSFDLDLLSSEKHKGTKKVASDEWFRIDELVYTEAIIAKYGNVNIVYSFFLNTPDDYVFSPFALFAVDKPLAFPYEMIWLPRNLTIPSVVAHETLHTFGAGDWYGFDDYMIQYYQPFDFPYFCKEYFPNDVMFTTSDATTGERLTDRISNEITDLTAYYIGWIDEPPFDLDGMKMRHSQYEKKKD